MNTHKNILMNIHKIMRFLRDSKVITTSELAEKFKVSWNTAEKYMLELALAGKALRIKKAGVNLWVPK